MLSLGQDKSNYMFKNNNNIFAIGDVHGCFYTLMKLIKKLPKNAELIFVGDLCDKGNFSKEVIEFVMQNQYKCILGNHEYLMLNNIDNPNSKWAVQTNFGGYKTIESYKGDNKTLQKHLEWIKTLPNYIIKDKFFITHGYGLPYYKRRDKEKSKRALMSNRKSQKYYEKWGHDWEDDFHSYDIINIFGHDYGSKPISDTNYFNIDSGCVYGEKLTAICLDTKELISVGAEDRDIVTFEKGFDFVPSIESPYGFTIKAPINFPKENGHTNIHSDTELLSIEFYKNTKKGQIHKNFLFDKDKNYITWKDREKQIKGKVETKDFEDGYKVVRTREINFKSEYEQTNDTLYKDEKIIHTSNSLATSGRWGKIDNIYTNYIDEIQRLDENEQERLENIKHILSLDLIEQKKHIESEIIHIMMKFIFYGPIRDAGPLKEVNVAYFKSQYNELEHNLYEELLIHAFTTFAITMNDCECYENVDVAKYIQKEAKKYNLKNAFEKYFNIDTEIDTSGILC